LPALDTQPPPYLLAHLRSRHMLVLGDCEQVIETIAPIAERVLQAAAKSAAYCNILIPLGREGSF
jgi:hypothetical protein